jgi:amidase
MEPYRLTGTQLLDAIGEGSLTVRQVAQALLDRIAERQPSIRAWSHLDAKAAFERAEELDALPLKERGPLHGLPIGIKDVILTRDMPTTYNSPVYSTFQPNIDAACITVLRKAGALILGKTQTTQFAATFVGTDCANPRDTRRTPGGSSSGSAAAVADFQVPVSLGTQTVGSVVRPSSYTGIFGYKPTWVPLSLYTHKTRSDLVLLFIRVPSPWKASNYPPSHWIRWASFLGPSKILSY